MPEYRVSLPQMQPQVSSWALQHLASQRPWSPPEEWQEISVVITGYLPWGARRLLGVDDDAVLVDFRPQQRRIPLPCVKLTKLKHPSAGYVRRAAGHGDAASHGAAQSPDAPLGQSLVSLA